MSYWDDARISDELRTTAKRVLDLAFELHTDLGPGFVESIYRRCFVHLLRQNGLVVREEVWLSMEYRGLVLDRVQKVDIVVEPGLLVELKSVERLAPVHAAQLVSYLKVLGLPGGLLINFNVKSLAKGFERCVNPDFRSVDSDDSADSVP